MSTAEPKPINRVALACIQCRGRHVKCDAAQPVCLRCQRDGKTCTYEKSRRGGLDKAALARRRMLLQQQANQTQQSPEYSNGKTTQEFCTNGDMEFISIQHTPPSGHAMETQPASSNNMIFQVSIDRLLDMYYLSFWPSFPFVLPQQHLSQRQMRHNHGMENLLLVLQWIGSIYAPWTASEPYYDTVRTALSLVEMPRDAWSIQALLLCAIAEHHWGLRLESKQTLDKATSLALALQMNKKEFAHAYGEGNLVLEEAWRRTYHFLLLTDQHFAVIVNLPLFALRDVPNLVDLPCEDNLYIAGQVPPPATWKDYDTRELEDVEIVYSSIVYMIDVSRIVTFIMQSFTQTGVFSDALIAAIDAKVAAWQALLPACKKDPMRVDGTIDEIIFQAHLMAATVMMTAHRPFSSLTYSLEELSTQSFVSPVPFIEPLKQSRSAHTAKVLAAINIKTKLLAIPCTMENHSVFVPCMVATLATAQISACNVLDDRALSIARDRLRLSIGCLHSMGTIWPLSKQMAKEVRFVARRTLANLPSITSRECDPSAEVEIPREEAIWPINTSAEIDIYTAINLPIGYEPLMRNYSISEASNTS